MASSVEEIAEATWCPTEDSECRFCMMVEGKANKGGLFLVFNSFSVFSFVTLRFPLFFAHKRLEDTQSWGEQGRSM